MNDLILAHDRSGKPTMTAEDLKFETEIVPDKDIVVLTLKGALDAHTFDHFQGTIHDLFERGCYRLVMDLSGIEYISSAGVGVFFSALTEARENNGAIVLVNISPCVRDVFNLLGLGQMFVLSEDHASAIAAIDGV